MTIRSLLHHTAGIASLCLAVALVYTAYSGVPAQVGFLFIIIAFMPGYYGLRYLRSLACWRAR